MTQIIPKALQNMNQHKCPRRSSWLLCNILILVLLAGCTITVPAVQNATSTNAAADSNQVEEHDDVLPTLAALDLADDERVRVVATTNIVADVVAQVGGSQIDLTRLIPVGGDPHSFEPTPQDLVALSEAHVIFINGLHLEESLLPILESLDNTAPIVTVNVDVETIEFGESSVAHACKHLDEEPQSSISATADIAATAAVTGTHARLDIALPSAEANYFTYTSEEAGEYLFYADGTLSLTLRDSEGTEHAAETVMEASDLTDCPGFVTAFGFDLVEGDNLLSIHDAENETVRFVVEGGEGEHDHDEHEDDHADHDDEGDEDESHEDESHEDESHEDEAHDDEAHDDDNHDGEGHDEHEHHHHHEGADPHTWFSVHAVEQWVLNIEQVLSGLDPAHADAFATSAATYRGDLSALEAELEEMVAELPVEQRKLVTDHDSFGYFADAYDFTIIGAIIPSLSTLASPSASELAALQDQIEAEGVPAIFVGTTVNPALAEQLAGDTGATVATVYTGAFSDVDGPAATYLDFMRYNMRTIVDALK